jgi:hypothetical protein
MADASSRDLVDVGCGALEASGVHFQSRDLRLMRHPVAHADDENRPVHVVVSSL